MRWELMRLRAAKLAYAATHRRCWRAMRCGVFPSVEHRHALRGLSPDLILDVGANRGQFALFMRTMFPAVRVVSFEPIPAEASVFRRVLGGDEGVSLNEVALGEEAGRATIHLSGRADSSSLLPIGELQRRLFPATGEVGTIEVEVRRLDDLPEVWTGSRRALLKLDVQGYELGVLKGAIGTLKHCSYVYAECSDVALYDGQALVGEVREFLGGCGFRERSRHNECRDGGRLIQADYLFGCEEAGEVGR